MSFPKREDGPHNATKDLRNYHASFLETRISIQHHSITVQIFLFRHWMNISTFYLHLLLAPFIWNCTKIMSSFISKDLILILESLTTINFSLLSFLYIAVQSDWKNYRNFLGLTTKLASTTKFFVFYTMKNRRVPTNSIVIILNFNIQNQFPPPKTQLVTQTELAQSCCLQDQQRLCTNEQEKAFVLNLC